MNFTNKFSARGTFVALASLLFVLFVPSGANAAEDLTVYYDIPTQSFVYSGEPAGVLPGGSMCIHRLLYAGVYPNVSGGLLDNGGLDCSQRGDTWESYLDFLGSAIAFKVSQQPDGLYWFGIDLFNCDGTGTPSVCTPEYEADYYFNAEIKDGLVVAATIDFNFDYVNTINNLNTRFTSVLFTDGTSNNGNVNFSIGYFLDLLEIDINNSSRNPSLVSIELAQRPSTNFSATSYSITPFVAGTSTESGTISSVANGTYDVLVRFTNASVLFGSPRPFSQSYVYTSIVMSGGNLTSMGLVEFYDGRKLETFEDYKYKDCSLTQFDNCFTNAFIYLFSPSLESLNIFSQINDGLSLKFPFAYVYDFSAIFTTIYNTEQSQTADISIPFAQAGEITLLSSEMLSEVPFSGLIRDSLAALLWFFLAYTLYRRSLTVFNSNT